MVHGGLYLTVHYLLHLSFGVPSVTAQGDEKHCGEDDEYAHDVVGSIAVVEVDDTCLHIVAYVVGLEHCVALLWRVGESGTDGVENGLGLELASEGAVVNHN